MKTPTTIHAKDAHVTDQAIKRYILECVEDEADTIPARIDYIRERFTSEYGWRVGQVGRQAALTDWLQGIALPIAFYNVDILRLCVQWGVLAPNASEAREDAPLAWYWQALAAKIGQLFDGFRVPDTLANTDEEAQK